MRLFARDVDSFRESSEGKRVGARDKLVSVCYNSDDTKVSTTKARVMKRKKRAIKRRRL